MSTPSLPSRYRLLGLLGEGGSGRVYRVHDSVRSRDLALKLVTGDEGAFLRREFDTLRQIRHENLIQVFDWGSLASGENYYTMELVEGEDWGRGMGRPQGDGEVRRILTGLLRGLAHLHCHREVHGDLKPGNVLLGLGGVVKLTDVGMGGGDGKAERASGTPGYAAPETWEGAPADVRSDLYSVGVMAYEALTGVHPFAGKTIRDVVAGQLKGWVASPGAHGVRVPPDLERVAMRALERDPGLRQGSADEFMEGMGVEDRVGQILGGKFVALEGHLEWVAGLLQQAAGGPTMLDITGPPGVGKSALMEELAWRLPQLGCRALVVGADATLSVNAQLAELLGHFHAAGNSTTQPVQDFSPSNIATALWECARMMPQAVLSDATGTASASDTDPLPAIAKYVFALSEEQKEPSRVLILTTDTEPHHPRGSFEASLRLVPLNAAQVCDQIAGLLGTVTIDKAFPERLRSLTGGIPSLVRAAVMECAARNLLARVDGVWSFREVEQLLDLDLPSLAHAGISRFLHLPPREKRLLEMMALLPDGVPTALGGETSMATLASLHAKGWVTGDRAGRWKFQSESLRQAVGMATDADCLREHARELLDTAQHLFSREERADLALLADPGPAILGDAAWAGEQAALRGDTRLARNRLERCLALANRYSRVEVAQDCALSLAEVLEKMGEGAGVLALLDAPQVWSAASTDAARQARREYLIGLALKSLGKSQDAREHFAEAARLSEEAGMQQLSLRSNVGLAEIDWTFGGFAGYEKAIELTRQLLARNWDDPTLLDERAALTYGLGAALIWAGRRMEAIPLLEAVLEGGCSDYWRMRIANAMGAALNGEGNPEKGLSWLNAAWEYAEKSGADSFKPRLLSNRGASLCALGRFREALDQDRLSAMWARRAGDVAEYASGRVGAAINEIYLGEYEAAIADARDALQSLGPAGPDVHVAKAYEMEALAHFHIGEYDKAAELAELALRRLEGGTYGELKPRIQWLLARLALVSGRTAHAIDLLRPALAQLGKDGDPEDRLEVEIEMLRARALSEGPQPILLRAEGVIAEAVRRGLPIVRAQLALCLVQVFLEREIGEDAHKDEIRSSLAWVERAGIVELGWQLNYYVGRLAARSGDFRAAQTRYTSALRILRSVADPLSDHHRRLYLSRPDVVRAMDLMSQPT